MNPKYLYPSKDIDINSLNNPTFEQSFSSPNSWNRGGNNYIQGGGNNSYRGGNNNRRNNSYRGGNNGNNWNNRGNGLYSPFQKSGRMTSMYGGDPEDDEPEFHEFEEENRPMLDPNVQLSVESRYGEEQERQREMERQREQEREMERQREQERELLEERRREQERLLEEERGLEEEREELGQEIGFEEENIGEEFRESEPEETNVWNEESGRPIGDIVGIPEHSNLFT